MEAYKYKMFKAYIIYFLCDTSRTEKSLFCVWILVYPMSEMIFSLHIYAGTGMHKAIAFFGISGQVQEDIEMLDDLFDKD